MQTGSSGSGMKVLTASEAKLAEARFRELVENYHARQKEQGIESTAVDYWVHKGLFAAAYGAEAVQVVPD